MSCEIRIEQLGPGGKNDLKRTNSPVVELSELTGRLEKHKQPGIEDVTQPGPSLPHQNTPITTDQPHEQSGMAG